MKTYRIRFEIYADGETPAEAAADSWLMLRDTKTDPLVADVHQVDPDDYSLIGGEMTLHLHPVDLTMVDEDWEGEEDE